MYDQLLAEAHAVLRKNDRGQWTVPAGDLYPHQWLWDSCFIAIGLRHVDIERAKTELRGLMRGQWRNGMLPNIIFSGGGLGFDRLLWNDAELAGVSKKIRTSGITQPPMLAEAVWRVGQKLKDKEQLAWYREMLPSIIRYHEWLYRERDPRQEGLVVIFHSYESGLDNSPYWIAELKKKGLPSWVKLIDKLHINWLINKARRDLSEAPIKERMSGDEALSFISGLEYLKRKGYDSSEIFKHPYMAVQDVAFNSILVRANSRLAQIAKAAGVKLPVELKAAMALNRRSLGQLWDEPSGQFYSRDYLSGELIKEPTVTTFLPLYAGTATPEQAKRLVRLMNNPSQYKTKWQLPCVPRSSDYFSHFRYWQGPVWLNINWLVIDGLARSGFDEEAQRLKKSSLALVGNNGCSEYFNPITGVGLGADNFSWTAALAIDLISA